MIPIPFVGAAVGKGLDWVANSFEFGNPPTSVIRDIKEGRHQMGNAIKGVSHITSKIANMIPKF